MKKTSIILFLAILFSVNISAQTEYKIKKAHIKYATETMGMSMETTLDFDNYGKDQAITAIIELMGFKKTSKILNYQNYMYVLDMDAKTAIKSPADNVDDIKEVDFDNIPQEMKEKYQIKELGNETVLGKTCQVFSMVDEGTKSKLWVWKNIPLKTEVEQSNMVVKMTAKEIDTNPNFPADNFKVPADFTISNMEE